MKKVLTRKQKNVYRAIMVLLIVIFGWPLLNDEHGYPEYSQLRSIEGVLINLVEKRKSRDALIVESKGIRYTFFSGHNVSEKKIINLLIGEKILVKYYKKEGVLSLDKNLAELYLNDEKILGDYPAFLKRVESGVSDPIRYPFLIIFAFFFILSFFTPDK